MFDSSPFFTIITATYNAEEVLPFLLESLAIQTNRNFELIIQDGASTDNTVQIAQSYKDKLPSLIINSQPDTGVFDAWNKAVQKISGKWVLFLGADDCLADAEVLACVEPVLQQQPQNILYGCGGINFFFTRKIYVEGFLEFDLQNIPYFLQTAIFPVDHSALFHRVSLFKENQFDTSFKIVGDQDFVARTWKKPQQGMNLNRRVTNMHAGGVSNAPATAIYTRLEYFRIGRKYCSLMSAVKNHAGKICGAFLLKLNCLLLGNKRTAKIFTQLRLAQKTRHLKYLDKKTK